MDESKQWKKAAPKGDHNKWRRVAHRLSQGDARLAEAETILDELPNTGLISRKLDSACASVERLCALVDERVKAAEAMRKPVAEGKTP